MTLVFAVAALTTCIFTNKQINKIRVKHRDIGPGFKNLIWTHQVKYCHFSDFRAELEHFRSLLIKWKNGHTLTIALAK